MAWEKNLLDGLLGTLILIPIYFVLKFRRLHKRWLKNGIVGYRTNLLLCGWFRNNYINFCTLDNIYKQYINEKCVGLHNALRPILMVINTNLISSIYKNVGSKFTRITNEDKRLKPLLGKMMDFTTYEELEQNVPNLLDDERLKELYEVAYLCNNELRMSLEAKAHDSGVINIIEELEKLKLDVIGMSFFGMKLGKIRDPKWRFKENITRLSSGPSMLDKIAKSASKESSLAKNDKDAELFDYFVQLYFECLNTPASARPHKSCKAFPTILHADDYHAVPSCMTTEETVGSLILFAQERVERIYSALAFALYEITANSSVQSKLMKDIKLNLKNNADDRISFQDLQSLKYLDKLILETLRKYPVSALLSTKCTESYKTDQLEIETGIDVIIPVLSIHRDYHHYPQPHAFDPDRFPDTGIVDVISQQPLLAHQIDAIGGEFGILLMKLALVLLIRDYEFKTCKQTPNCPLSMNQQTSYCLKPVSKIMVRITSRSEEKGFYPYRLNCLG